ncbi:hypothetical protein P0D90_01530 [Pseudomonas sp. CBSPCBW29]|nr:hypothetical protein P0D90_01530 [Pseudomonas sp. CBSPCBW29]
MSTPPNALADESLHTALIKARLPTWVAHMAPVDVRRLKHGLLPGWERPATKVPLSPALNKALDDSRKASRQSREALAKNLGALQGIVEFAQPKLEAALREAMGEAPDVNKNQLHYLRYRQAPQQHSLLQAALLNFEGDEDFTDIALEQTSALAPQVRC